jgi:hypothetical protein
MADGDRQFVFDTDVIGSLKNSLRVCISIDDFTDPAETIALTDGGNLFGKLRISKL